MLERLKTLILNIRTYAEFRRQAKQPGCSKQLDVIADDIEAAIRPQWVSVSERLPDTPREVWVLADGDIFRAVYCLEWTDVMNFPIDKTPTHWHEIEYPEPPECKS